MKIKTFLGVCVLAVMIIYIVVIYGIKRFFNDWWQTAQSTNWEVPLGLLILMLFTMIVISSIKDRTHYCCSCSEKIQ